MLYLIGIGIYDEKDISLRGFETLKGCDEVYAEFYTGVHRADLPALAKSIGRKINILTRREIEENPDQIFKAAKNTNTALLIPGDPMVATTHIDLVLRAEKLGIETKVIHSSSIYTAISEIGIQIYKFGKTTSIVFPTPSYSPKTPYGVLKGNLEQGMHTLFLLDIGMTLNEGIRILLEIEKMELKGIFNELSPCVGAAHLGGDSVIKFGRAKELLDYDFGPCPHSLIVPGKLHFMEKEALDRFKVTSSPIGHKCN